MMFSRLTTVIAAASLAMSTVSASGQIAQVVDANNFCVFLPPNSEANRNIADTEWNANAFCMGSTPGAKGADTMPAGFITSAHYVATDAYVQVTGMMDYSKARLNGSDEGGQYDVRAPMGSSCAGWSYYVNLIEPISNTYCMRCCNDTVSCNRGISEKGCAHIIPGDYSGPNGKAAAAADTTTTTPAAAKTTTTKSSTSTHTTTPKSDNTNPNASNSTNTTDNVVTAQSVNAAGSIHPGQTLVLGAAAVAAALYFA